MCLSRQCQSEDRMSASAWVLALFVLVFLVSATDGLVAAEIPEASGACRANLCSSVTTGLRCQRGAVLHVLNLTCEGGHVSCSPATYLTLYTLCEGRQSCDASGLRMLTPLAMYCQNQTSSDQSSSLTSLSPEFRNIFVDYVCVPESMVWNDCAGQYETLREPFGVVMNPGFVGGVLNTDMQCDWFLTPEDKTRVVHVLVHMAYSQRNSLNCTTNFLQLRYKDCLTGDSITKQFCDLSDVNSPITSCGPVQVSSWLPTASDQTDRFLLSYQMLAKGSEARTPSGMAACGIPLATSPPTTLTTQPTVPSHNYGPGGTMFDYSDTIRHTGGDTESEEQRGKTTPETKVIILYIFFGVVIVALVIALVYVLVRYQVISRHGHHHGDTSEKLALWQYDDTPMDTFNLNSHASLSDTVKGTSSTLSSSAVTGQLTDVTTADSQMVACTVHSESVHKEDILDNPGTRFSSFLPARNPGIQDLLSSGETQGSDSPPQDSFHHRESAENGGWRVSSSSTRGSSFKVNGEINNISKGTSTQQYPHRPQHRSQEDEGEHTPLVPLCPSPPLLTSPPPKAPGYVPSDLSCVEHYMINDDEYAVVRKPKSPITRKGSQFHGKSPTSCGADFSNSSILPDHQRELEYDPTYDSIQIFQDNTDLVVGFRPTSGPYDRDRSLKSELVPTSSGGATRHRWDEL